jgi:hypothetical protein
MLRWFLVRPRTLHSLATLGGPFRALGSCGTRNVATSFE